MVLLLAGLSCFSGWLMSQPSLVGKVGIDLFYKEYQFLRTWWQGSMVVFSVLIFLTLLQGFIFLRSGRKKNNWIQVFMILLALGGLYLSYYDFHHTTTHRWLRERFHIGAYIFWMSWIIISIYYMTIVKNETPEV